MDAASDSHNPAHGEARLLTTVHCLTYVDDIRPSAVARLERAVGDELARFLLGALSGRDHRTRPRDLVA